MSKRHRARPHQMNSTFLRHSTFQPFQLIVLVDCNFRPVSHGQLARPPVGAALHHRRCHSQLFVSAAATFQRYSRFAAFQKPSAGLSLLCSALLCFALLCSALSRFALLCFASLCFSKESCAEMSDEPSGWCSPSGKRARIRGQLQCPAVILTE